MIHNKHIGHTNGQISAIANMCLGGKEGWKAAYHLYRYDIKYGTNYREHPDLYDLFDKYENTFPIKKPDPVIKFQYGSAIILDTSYGQIAARLIERMPQQGVDILKSLEARLVIICKMKRRFEKTGEFNPKEFEQLEEFYKQNIKRYKND